MLSPQKDCRSAKSFLAALNDLKVHGRPMRVPIVLISFILVAFGISSLSSVGCKAVFSAKPRSSSLVGPRSSQPANGLNENTAVVNYFFSHAREDRSGAVIQDMIFALAYAFQYNLTYMGACVGRDVTERLIRRHRALVHTLGLDDVLHFACPERNQGFRIFSGSVYGDERLLTPAFLNWIRKQRKYTGETKDTSASKVVVHIRRGDVSLCNTQWFRYTPNLYYHKILDYLTDPKGPSYKPQEVTIHSESKSMENFESFKKYNVVLDGELSNVYNDMVNAEVLVLARSSFSTVPALLNPNAVIYNSNWHEPLHGWYAVNRSLQEMVDVEASRLRNKMCKF